jgi:hypothetical protein
MIEQKRIQVNQSLIMCLDFLYNISFIKNLLKIDVLLIQYGIDRRWVVEAETPKHGQWLKKLSSGIDWIDFIYLLTAYTALVAKPTFY